MGDFSTPFAESGDRRLPTAAERLNGFACGPADRELFNGLLHRLEAENDAIIAQAGLTPSDATNDQVRRAIQAIVLQQMNFGATLNPALPNEDVTNVRGGVFNNLQTIIDAAPAGARIDVSLATTDRWTLDYDATPKPGQNISLAGPSTTTRTIIDGASREVEPGIERQFNFFCVQGASWQFRNLTFNVPSLPSGQAWDNGFTCRIRNLENGDPVRASLINSQVNNGLSGSTASFAWGHVGSVVEVSGWNVTVNAGYLARLESSVGLFPVHLLTLNTGAAVQTGGTVGTSVLEA